MPPREPERLVTQSILDRLSQDAEEAYDLRSSMQQFRDAVRRDLEWLLNTRRTPDAAPESMPELRASLHNYGVPDPSILSRDAYGDRERLRQYVEESIALFEPRLAAPRVTLVRPEGEDAARREVRFVVEATLRMDPVPEAVRFDTVLEVSSGGYQVRGAAGA